MAGNIKGITIAFAGDTTKLDKALREINNNTRSLDKELRNVDKALKFNPTNVDLWRQKQTLLAQKITETRNKLDVLKQAQAQMDADGVDKNSEEYRKLQREIIETESKLKNFEAQQRKIGNVNLRAASEQFKEYGTKLTAAGQAMRGVSMAAAGMVASLGAIAVKAGQSADDFNTLSKVTGIGTAELQKYSYAADLVDVSVETIAKANKKLTKSAYDAANGSKSQAEAFDALGVSVVDSEGNLRDSEAIFQDVLSALGQMTNETERDALAQKILGKSAAELNPLIEDGGETYKRVADTLAKYNLDYVDQETLDKANAFNDELDTMKLLGKVALSQVGSQLAAQLAPALEKVVEWMGKLAEWIGNLNPKVLTVVGIIAGVLAVVSPLLLGLGKMAFAISSILSLAATIGPVLGGVLATMGPIIAVIAAVVAAGVLLYKNWDTIKAKALELWTAIQEKFEAIRLTIQQKIDAVKTFLAQAWAAIKTAAGIAWNLIKMAVLGPIGPLVMLLKNNWDTIRTTATNIWNAIKTTAGSVWEGIKEKITSPIEKARDKIKGVFDKIKGMFPINLGKIINFSIPKITLKTDSKTVLGKTITYPTGFDVTWHKKAMENPYMFSSPTLFGAGEAGDEILYGRNSLMRDISTAVSNAQQPAGETVINININGANKDSREIAEEVKRVLIQETNRRRLAWQ